MNGMANMEEHGGPKDNMLGLLGADESWEGLNSCRT